MWSQQQLLQSDHQLDGLEDLTLKYLRLLQDQGPTAAAGSWVVSGPVAGSASPKGNAASAAAQKSSAHRCLSLDEREGGQEEEPVHESSLSRDAGVEPHEVIVVEDDEEEAGSSVRTTRTASVQQGQDKEDEDENSIPVPTSALQTPTPSPIQDVMSQRPQGTTPIINFDNAQSIWRSDKRPRWSDGSRVGFEYEMHEAQEIFECEHDCGFESKSKEEVEQHELTCKNQRSGRQLRARKRLKEADVDNEVIERTAVITPEAVALDQAAVSKTKEGPTAERQPNAKKPLKQAKKNLAGSLDVTAAAAPKQKPPKSVFDFESQLSEDAELALQPKPSPKKTKTSMRDLLRMVH